VTGDEDDGNPNPRISQFAVDSAMPFPKVAAQFDFRRNSNISCNM